MEANLSDKPVNILLVANSSSGKDMIKKQLEKAGKAWSVSECETLAGLAEVPLFRGGQIDLILLDLTSASNGHKDLFLQVKNKINLPIIVITSRYDESLISFTRDAGSADNISQWQIRGDPGRLANMIESCIERSRVSRNLRQQSAEDTQSSEADCRETLLRNEAKQAALSAKAMRKADKKINDLEIKNALLNKENDALRFNLSPQEPGENIQRFENEGGKPGEPPAPRK